MKRFFERIRQKALDITQPPVVIVAFGDSNTQGATQQKLLDSEGVYHRFLQQALEEFYPLTAFSTINAGVGGDTAKRAAHRVQRDVIRYQPDLVLVAFGTNDSGGGLEAVAEFEDSLTNIVSQIKDQSEADVLLLTPPFMAAKESALVHTEHRGFIDSVNRVQNEGVLLGYVEGIRKIAERNKVILADVYQEWVRLAETGLDTDLWLINGLNHPDRRGHRLAAHLIFHTLLSQRDATRH